MEKIIKALTSCTISTKLDRVDLVQGEVASVKFCNKDEFNAHLQSGFFVEWYEQPVAYEIPVVNSPTFDEAVDEPVAPEVIVVSEPELEVEEAPIFDTTEKELTDEDEIVDEPVAIVEIDDLDEEDKQALLERENAKGRPFKCLMPGCDRLRKKDALYCKVCQAN